MQLFSWQCRARSMIACLALLGWSAAGWTQDQAATEQTAEQLATVCAACHGIDGNSSTPIWPKLAGQHAEYMARQTRMIRDGQRSVPEMLGIIAGWSDDNIRRVSEYFAEQQLKPGVADEELVALGKTIYQSGLPEQGVIGCQGCHGPAGKGNVLAHYPRLAGQHADYTISRLQRYRDGNTNGEDDPYSPQMALVAENLSDHEIEAVASYLEGLYDQRQQ